MELIGLALAVIAALAALLVVPEVRRRLKLNEAGPGAAPQPSQARFVGELDHFRKAVEFRRFLGANEGGVVFIDAWIPEERFDGSIDGSTRRFVLFEECDSLDEKEPASAAKCTGTEYSVVGVNDDSDSQFSFLRGVYKLRGHFAVVGFEGPFQGLMGCKLRVVAIERAP